MKKISLTIITLFSLAVLAACGHNSVSTTPSEVIETTEEVIETTEETRNFPDHPDWDSTYEYYLYDEFGEKISKTTLSEFDYVGSENRDFEYYNIFDARDNFYVVSAVAIDGVPLSILSYDLYDPEMTVKEFLDSGYTVWDLASVQEVKTDTAYEKLYTAYTKGVLSAKKVDENWNFIK